MLKRIRNWFWKRRVKQALSYLRNDIPIVLNEGSIEIKKPLPPEKDEKGIPRVSPLFSDEGLIITVNGKPVCEATFHHYMSGPYCDLKRFNYGAWVQELWRYYCHIKRADEHKQRVINAALFGDLEEK